MPIIEPDYLQIWQELTTRGHGWFSLKFDHKDKAQAYDIASRKKNLGRRDVLLDFVKQQLKPEDTAIDIGAGTGRWTIPLAGVVSKVTAIEPSKSMSDILMFNAEKAGVAGKINLVTETWENAVMEKHDIVACFHAMYMSADFPAFIHKLEAHTRRYCYLGIRHFPIDGIIQELGMKIHGSRHDSPNFIIAYNALYQMGIYANVFMEDLRQTWTDATLPDAFTRAKRHLNLVDDSTHDELLHTTLKRRLVFQDGLYYWPDSMSTALVWWKVTGK
jgi:SAM-dependent methyltransferase